MRLCMHRAIKETPMSSKIMSLKLKVPLNLLTRSVLSTMEIFEWMENRGTTITLRSL